MSLSRGIASIFNRETGKSRGLRVHVLCWLLFGIYEASAVFSIQGNLGNPWIYLTYFIFNISFFYIHAGFTLPAALRRKSAIAWRVPLLILLQLAVYVSLSLLISYTTNTVFGRGDGLAISGMVLFNVAWRGVYFMLYGTGYYFLKGFIEKKREQMAHEKQLKQLNEQLHQMEIDYLRAQINPHFLFNTLSFINYSAKHSPDQADEAIVLLKEILDFITRGTNQKQVTVEQEFQQMEKLIRLNQLRFGNKLSFQIDKNIHSSSQSVIPMVLLTLVENIFKHGDFRNDRQPVVIRVESDATKVRYFTRNVMARNSAMHSHGTGLANVALRLEKTYPEKHRFEYRTKDNVFEVDLEVMLN